MSRDLHGRLRAYLDGELDPDARAELEAELEGSTELRAALDEERALGEQVDALLGRPTERRERTPDWDHFIARARPSRSRWSIAIAAVAATLAAALLFAWWGARTRAIEGDLVASASRQTIGVGDRAIAVAEPGARLEWAIEASGNATVTQSQGAVFYRVEPGGTFEVRTPAGSVTVTGTCFTLEVVSMKEWTKRHGPGAVVGALVGGALVLTVHEGSVVLANADGSMAVDAGESAHAVAGSPPRAGEASAMIAARDDDDAIDALRRRDSEQRDRIAELEQQLGLPAAPSEPEPTAPEDRVRLCATSMGDPACSTVDPGQDVLEEMARCGSIKIDEPKFLDESSEYAPPDELVGLVGLTEDEIAKITEANRAFAERHSQALQQIVADLEGGQAPMIPPGAPPWAIISSFTSVLDASAPDEEASAIRRTIARERAGLASPPASLDAVAPLERYERIRADVGEAYEAALAEVLGADRAHELRVADDGWGQRQLIAGRCPDEPPPEE